MGIFGFGQGNGPTPPQMPFPMNMVQQFNQFRQTFQGNPQEQVQQLLNSGQMTQEQFSQLQQMAQQFGQFFK